MPPRSSNSSNLFSPPKSAPAAHTAHVDGGARGNPGPAGYGVAITDASGHPIAELSDSELMVRQIKGIYKVRHPELRKLYDEAQQLVRRLEHFEISHALREHNKTADRLANQAMDRGQR
jgi:ribonuclease HI